MTAALSAAPQKQTVFAGDYQAIRHAHPRPSGSAAHKCIAGSLLPARLSGPGPTWVRKQLIGLSSGERQDCGRLQAAGETLSVPERDGDMLGDPVRYNGCRAAVEGHQAVSCVWQRSRADSKCLDTDFRLIRKYFETAEHKKSRKNVPCRKSSHYQPDGSPPSQQKHAQHGALVKLQLDSCSLVIK
jgi:hypothetical protein